MTTKKPTRRPRHAYNRRLVDLICERIAVDGVALREICQDTSMPARSTLFIWLRRHPEFARKYTFAKLFQIQGLSDDMIDIAEVHDYHLIPLAAELRPLGLANLIGYFHHIPWPAPEVLGTLPGSTDLLRAIMDFNLVGVQTERDADNLRRALIQELSAVPQKRGILVRTRKEHVREKLSHRH